MTAGTIVLGVGSERGADGAALAALAEQCLIEAGIAADTVSVVASLDLKMNEPAVTALAARLGVPTRFFDAATLEAETPRLVNPSERIFRAVGCHGVAEAAALAAAGPLGQLILPRRSGRGVTCALARMPGPGAP